ncbi:MAG: hypothetical protein IKU57_02980 [Oscillospiraceae bacterium]|nr:hypothetical protein [Oscillospiraceae bacterium]
MAKRIFLFFYLGLYGFLLCVHVSQPPQVRPLICQLDVYCRLDGEHTQMHLTQERQIKSLMCCLRAANTHITAQEPPQEEDADFCLVQVRMSDGKHHIYRQVSTEYFSKDSGPWKQIKPEQGSRLFAVLRTLKTQSFQGAFLFCDNFFLLFRNSVKFLTNVPRITPFLLYEMELFI